MYRIPIINSSKFSFEKWTSGSLTTLAIYTRSASIAENRRRIIKYAIGYCQGECLPVRPKTETFAVMFYFDGCEFWTHFTGEEFKRIFSDD